MNRGIMPLEHSSANTKEILPAEGELWVIEYPEGLFRVQGKAPLDRVVVKWIQFTSSHLISLLSISILFYHPLLCLLREFLISGFSNKIWYVFLISPYTRIMGPISHLPWFQHLTNKSTNHIPPQSEVFCTSPSLHHFLDPNILSRLFSDNDSDDTRRKQTLHSQCYIEWHLLCYSLVGIVLVTAFLQFRSLKAFLWILPEVNISLRQVCTAGGPEGFTRAPC